MKTAKTHLGILIALSLFVIVFVFFLYTFLHEAGHALAGNLFGQSLTEFDLSFWDLSAHVGLAGGDLTQAQLAIRSAAGTFLPLLVWSIFMGLVPRKGNFVLEELKLISSMLVINTLLAWIVLPVLFKFGRAPADDVTSFLVYSQMSPLLLSLTAILLYAGGWLLFLSRIDGFRNEFLMFRTGDRDSLLTGTRTTIISMAGILMFCVFLTFTLASSSVKHSLDRFSPPPDFVPVAQVDLSVRPYSSAGITQFTLDTSSYVSVFVVVRNINTSYFDLSLVRPDGRREVVLHGEGYRANEDGGLWEKDLPAGTYQLVLTSAQSSGTASVYLKKSKH